MKMFTQLCTEKWHKENISETTTFIDVLHKFDALYSILCNIYCIYPTHMGVCDDISEVMAAVNSD
jgi:hypothetical protein